MTPQFSHILKRHNIPVIPVNDNLLNAFVWKNPAYLIPSHLVSAVIGYLNSAYVFKNTPVFIENSSYVDFYKLTETTPINEDLVFVISVHERIIIMLPEDYKKYHKTYTSISSISEIYLPKFNKQLELQAKKRPVIISTKEQKQISFIEVYWNRIIFDVHARKYEIPRSIFDMLYVESEDFCPTIEENSKVKIHSQVRHSITWDSEYICDLLKSDIGMICYTQDLLKKEYETHFSQEQPMLKKVIAVHGIIGSGKDTVVTLMKMHIALSRYSHLDVNTVSNWLETAISNIEHSDWLLSQLDVAIERFAYPLKTCIAGFFGYDVDTLNSQAVKKHSLDPTIWYADDAPELTIRDLHTRIADAIKGCINPMIFANTCMERAKKSDKNIVIINDLRMPEELEVLLQNNVYLVKIQRPEAERARKEYLEAHHQLHSSEQGLPSEQFNSVIRNDSTYMDLSIKVADMLLDAGILKNEYVKNYKHAAETVK